MPRSWMLRTCGALVLATTCLLLTSTASAASALRGWWPMNERHGQAVYDWSGNGNHGMLGSTRGPDEHDPTWIRGIFNVGSALHFDGDDYVSIADDASLRPERVTVSAWFRSAGSPGPFRYLVAKGADRCEASSYALYTTGSGQLAFYVYDGSDWVRTEEAPDSVWDGEWHHVAGTFDGATLRLFIDGTQVGSGTEAATAIAYDLPSAAGALGAYQGSCALYLVGDLDGVSIWDRALPIEHLAHRISRIVGGR